MLIQLLELLKENRVYSLQELSELTNRNLDDIKIGKFKKILIVKIKSAIYARFLLKMVIVGRFFEVFHRQFLNGIYMLYN